MKWTRLGKTWNCDECGKEQAADAVCYMARVKRTIEVGGVRVSLEVPVWLCAVCCEVPF